MRAKSVLAAAFALALVGAFALAGCSGSNSNSGSSSSSDSKELSGTVATNGSTSMEEVIGSLSEQFMSDNSGVTVTYDATGSGTGIESVGNGTADIGLASRDLKSEESGLTATTIAKDGIAIIVNEKNDLDDLTIKQIASIFTGKVKNFSKVGGSNSDIAVIGREAGSGTRDGFESITGTEDACKLSQELTSTGAVIQAVQNSKNAIGYASYASVKDQKGIKILKVEGVDISEDTIADGSYKIQRPFNLVTKDGTELSDAAQAFFDYATSADAAELITEAGCVPTAK